MSGRRPVRMGSSAAGCAIKTATGGNVGLRELGADAAEYDVNILEVAASNALVDEIYERESLWKIKLGTRAVGLNRN